MANRRTRAEKMKAKHQLNYSWNPKLKTPHSEPNVKRQIEKISSTINTNSLQQKKAKYLAKDDNFSSIKKDIAKSLLASFFIIGIEIMLYLALKT